MKTTKVSLRTSVGLIMLLFISVLFTDNLIASEPNPLGNSVTADEKKIDLGDLVVVSESVGRSDIHAYLRNALNTDKELDKNSLGFVKVFLKVAKDGSLLQVVPVETDNKEFALKVVDALKKVSMEPIIQNGFAQSYSVILPISFAN